MKQIIIILIIIMVGCKPKPDTPPPLKPTCSNIHGSDQYGDYIMVDTIKVYGMMDACNDSGCGQ